MSGGAYICKIFARAARAQRALYFYIVYPIYAPGKRRKSRTRPDFRDRAGSLGHNRKPISAAMGLVVAAGTPRRPDAHAR